MSLADLQRPSGVFAMLAVDQREALRQMMSASLGRPATDEELVRFKVAATRTLSPHASGVLVDKQFALDRVIVERAVAAGCALIGSADRFHPAHGELVGEVDLDPAVDAVALADQGVVALKLLVLYRPDQPADPRLRLVDEFVRVCASAGMVSIIEPVSRKPLDGRAWDWNEGVLAAAAELGRQGADLYKAEMPRRGDAPPNVLQADCRAITDAVGSPWVVLSSGVPEDRFAASVETACRSGAQGFLAGRAVWASCLESPDVEQCLRTAAIDRIVAFGEAAERGRRSDS